MHRILDEQKSREYIQKQQKSAPNSVIPGQDQGSYPNDGTNACDRISILQSMNIRFLVLARNDDMVILFVKT